MTSRWNLALIPERALKYFEANPNALVIDDNLVMARMATEILDDVGFEVITVPNGKAALEMLKQHRVDFIVLDLLLPEMDGFQFYEQLQSNPDTKDIPVLIASALADDNNIQKAEKLGIKHFLPKPWTEDELLYSILTLLIDKSRGNRQRDWE